jgi:hypothetical protein
MRNLWVLSGRTCVTTAAAVVLALGGGTTACTGILDGGSSAAMGGPPGSAASPSGGSSGLGGTANAGGSTAGGAPVAPPGYKSVHRLSATEYNATVADVLETSLQPANGSWAVYESSGFDNFAAVQHVTGDEFQRMFDAAETLATEAFSRAAFKSRWVTCATTDSACVSSIVGKLGLHVLRRPLTAGELTSYLALYDAAKTQGENHEGSLKQVLRAQLASSEFLYRMEFDDNPTSVERHPLSSYELASRLSYLLWSSAPDDALLAAAGDDSLKQDATIKAQVDRLLADPVRATRFVLNFYGQWLGARRLASHPVKSDVYPEWSPQLADSLAREMYTYFWDFLQGDRSWLEFLTTDENFVDATSASYYGMPTPAGSGLQKVTFTSDPRVGFLGLGGFLALSSVDRRSSPTQRGRWIMSNLLCETVPPVPDNVPKLELAAPTTDLSKGNVRAILEKHRADPGCAGCHKLFDPFGMPLEQFDGIGKFRATYSDGSAIKPDAELSDGTNVTNLLELSNALAKAPQLTQCITDTLYGYGLGRSLAPADRGVLDSIHQTWKNDKDVPSIRRLIETIALDPNFRSRSGQAP